MKPFAVIALCVLTFFNTCCAAADVNVIPSKVQFGMQDNLRLLTPDSIRIGGFLGERIEANWKNRLLKVDEEPLLAGFRKKPGSHPWIGEHIGKWLHAATLAWVYSGDEELKKKLDRVAAELIKTQEPDGYIGTYVPEKRFGLYPEADWDVWVHKYVMIGLLTYYQYTGNQEALQTCIKAADLLLKTFGPDKKNIISAGTHVGMAATSVLEPIVMLYDFTGDERYLKFALYIVDSWDSPNGPAILKSLLSQGNVSKTANGKAYEMLSNLVGLCELARVTGERKYVEAAIRAWEDIVSKRLYITGSASQGEHFRGDFELPNGESAHVAETCVTVTWIQLNLQLLRLTGEARYANELERTIYNHLSAEVRIKNDAPPVNAVFRTFADAGSDGGNYRIWLRSPARSLPENLSVLSDGKEERSRRGNVVGSIIDGDRLTYVVTFDGKLADEDYYSVTLNNPVSIKKIVFCHGHSFHDGGWFDTSGGKPVIQIKRTPQSQWETIGRIESYPDTTATKDPRLKDGQPFEFILNEPVKICGIKISGKPACGDNPKQAFSSCGELEAY